MARSAVRKVTRAASLALFVLATTSGVAGVAIVAASPAMADPGGQPGGTSPGQPGDPTATVTKLVGDTLGGSTQGH